MNKDMASVSVSSYLRPTEYSHATDVTIWKHGSEPTSPEMSNRFTISFHAGPTTMYLRPTLEEAHKLIDALEWAMGAQA